MSDNAETMGEFGGFASSFQKRLLTPAPKPKSECHWAMRESCLLSVYSAPASVCQRERVSYSAPAKSGTRSRATKSGAAPFATWRKARASPPSARQFQSSKNTHSILHINDRETRRYNMFGTVQTFGKDHSGQR